MWWLMMDFESMWVPHFGWKICVIEELGFYIKIMHVLQHWMSSVFMANFGTCVWFLDDMNRSRERPGDMNYIGLREDFLGVF